MYMLQRQNGSARAVEALPRADTAAAATDKAGEGPSALTLQSEDYLRGYDLLSLLISAQSDLAAFERGAVVAAAAAAAGVQLQADNLEANKGAQSMGEKLPSQPGEAEVRTGRVRLEESRVIQQGRPGKLPRPKGVTVVHAAANEPVGKGAGTGELRKVLGFGGSGGGGDGGTSGDGGKASKANGEATPAWPLVLRVKIVTFAIAVGLASQAQLWGAFSESDMITRGAGLHQGFAEGLQWVFWLLGMATLVAVSIAYTIKALWYWVAVVGEWNHPIRLNFFFAPVLAAMLLAIAEPRALREAFHEETRVSSRTFAFLALLLLTLEMCVYSDWFFKVRTGLRRTNPAYQLAVVGNFLLASLAQQVPQGVTDGTEWFLHEVSLFFFTIGMVFYMVVFVCAHQNSAAATNSPGKAVVRDRKRSSPRDSACCKDHDAVDVHAPVKIDDALRPIYFLFIAPPSAAAVGWADIAGSFDSLSRCLYDLALFLYMFLAVGNAHFLWRARFSISWWAFSFPAAAFANATLAYAAELNSHGLAVFALCMGVLSTALVTVVTARSLSATAKGAFFKPDPVVALPPADSDSDSEAEACARRDSGDSCAEAAGCNFKLKKMAADSDPEPGPGPGPGRSGSGPGRQSPKLQAGVKFGGTVAVAAAESAAGQGSQSGALQQGLPSQGGGGGGVGGTQADAPGCGSSGSGSGSGCGSGAPTHLHMC